MLGMHYTVERFSNPTLKTSWDYRVVKTWVQMVGFWDVFRIREEKEELILRCFFCWEHTFGCIAGLHPSDSFKEQCTML